jgi:hypothetical protein
MPGFPSRAIVIQNKLLGTSVSCRVVKKAAIHATTMNAAKYDPSVYGAVACESSWYSILHGHGETVEPVVQSGTA